MTYDEHNVTVVEVRYHGDMEYVCTIRAVEGTLSLMLSWPRDAGVYMSECCLSRRMP